MRRIVYSSSVATLGLYTGRRPADETTPATLDDMIGHYKRSKYLAERRSAADRAAGLPAVIVIRRRRSGRGDAQPTPTGRIVLEAARGRMPAYVETGLDMVHVDDVADGHLLAFGRGRIGKRYILGGENLPLGAILTTDRRAGRAPAARVRLRAAALLPIALLAEALPAAASRRALVTTDGCAWRGRACASARQGRARARLSRAPAAAALATRWRGIRARGDLR